MLLQFAQPASAHLLDAYLQTAQVTIGPTDVLVSIDLTPGTQIAPSVLKAIDTDGDGAISQQEVTAYAASAVSHLSLWVDGRPLHVRFIAATFPGIDEFKTGSASIQLRASADLPPLDRGEHRLVFENGFRVRSGLYLANAMLPQERRIAILGQERSLAQDHLEITYRLANSRATSVSWAGGMLVLFSAGAWVLRRRAMVSGSSGINSPGEALSGKTRMLPPL